LALDPSKAVVRWALSLWERVGVKGREENKIFETSPSAIDKRGEGSL